MKKTVEDLKADRSRLREEINEMLITAEKLQQQADGVLAQRSAMLNKVDATAGKIHKLNLDISTLSTVREILKPKLGRPRKMVIE